MFPHARLAISIAVIVALVDALALVVWFVPSAGDAIRGLVGTQPPAVITEFVPEVKALSGTVLDVTANGFTLQLADSTAYTPEFGIRQIQYGSTTVFLKKGTRKDPTLYQQQMDAYNDYANRAENNEPDAVAYVQARGFPDPYTYDVATSTTLQEGQGVVVLTNVDVRKVPVVIADTVRIESEGDVSVAKPFSKTISEAVEGNPFLAAAAGLALGFNKGNVKSTPAPQGNSYDGLLHWSGVWTSNQFWCDAGYTLTAYHYDCQCSNNTSWYACVADTPPASCTDTGSGTDTHTVQIDCSSLKYKYQECPLGFTVGTVQSISVVKQYSYCNHMKPYDCTPYPGTNYGIKNNNTFWVDRGYRARFAITYTTPSQCGQSSCYASERYATAGAPITWTATPVGGVAPYTYVWSGTDDLSGTQSTVTKQYQSAGDKSASVVVKDSTGAVQNLTCSGPVTVTPNGDSRIKFNTGNGTGDKLDLEWSTTDMSSCRSTMFDTDGKTSGSVLIDQPLETTTYDLMCLGTDGNSATATVTVEVKPATLVLKATPSIVKKGGTSTISWGVIGKNVQSCQVSGPSLFATSTSGSKLITITDESLYTLSCLTAGHRVSTTATVRIAPTFGEF